MNNSIKNSVTLFLIFLLSCSLSLNGQKAIKGGDLKHWPKGSSPREIGKRIAEHFVASPHFNYFRSTPATLIVYPETCTWYGALTYAKLTDDKKLIKKLSDRFEPLFGSDSMLIPNPNHVDNTVFGAVPLELFIITKDQRYLKTGQRLADKQWDTPSGNTVSPDAWRFYNKGLTPQTRLWIDDMYMITAVQVQAYRATGDKKYIDRAAREMVLYIDSLQRPNGLFYHAPDVPFFWGRGNGWMAAGMSELLLSLPKDNPDRPRIMEGYKKMMATLLKYQAENGTWRQLIDKPEAWTETSGSGMFAFAMITGVKNGWLDNKTYAHAARRAWLGLLPYIDANDEIHEVCEGTGKKNDLQYYFDRKRNTGDLHGQAPILWCASALLR
ncbi:MAG: glycoside hydrolase family 88 protein [Bacteroidales bacterium]